MWAVHTLRVFLGYLQQGLSQCGVYIGTPCFWKLPFTPAVERAVLDILGAHYTIRLYPTFGDTILEEEYTFTLYNRQKIYSLSN